jgi:tetratricopeptide (TPR) repeat protein
MYMSLNNWGKALEAYEVNLKKHPNRFNGLYGAGLAAEKGGQIEKATIYYNKILAIGKGSANRPEINTIKTFLNNPANQNAIVRNLY